MKLALAILLSLSTGTLPAQQRLTILLDPARGGSEYGVRIDDHTYEKQATLDLANRLRALLNARDFNVVLTREADIFVSNDARATLANQSKPIACLLIHTASSGTGLHLFTSSLTPQPPSSTAVLWDEAQAPFVTRSQRLSNELTTAFTRSRIPVSSARTWVRPLDNMQCPTVAIEIAPESDGTKPTGRAYQTRIADAIAGAMLFWRGHEDIVQSITGPPPPPPKPAAEATPAGNQGNAASSQKTPTAASKTTPPPATPGSVGSPSRTPASSSRAAAPPATKSSASTIPAGTTTTTPGANPAPPKTTPPAPTKRNPDADIVE